MKINDLTLLLFALVLGAAGTALPWAAGARLGAALTLGVGLMIVLVVAGLPLVARPSA